MNEKQIRNKRRNLYFKAYALRLGFKVLALPLVVLLLVYALIGACLPKGWLDGFGDMLLEIAETFGAWRDGIVHRFVMTRLNVIKAAAK